MYVDVLVLYPYCYHDEHKQLVCDALLYYQLLPPTDELNSQGKQPEFLQDNLLKYDIQQGEIFVVQILTIPSAFRYPSFVFIFGFTSIIL